MSAEQADGRKYALRANTINDKLTVQEVRNIIKIHRGTQNSSNDWEPLSFNVVIVPLIDINIYMVQFERLIISKQDSLIIFV